MLKKIMNGSFSNHLKGGTIKTKTKTNKLCFIFFSKLSSSAKTILIKKKYYKIDYFNKVSCRSM